MERGSAPVVALTRRASGSTNCSPGRGLSHAAQRLIDAGQVLVDGATARKRHRVAAGERVDVSARRRPASDGRRRGGRAVRGGLGGRAPARGRQAGRRRRPPGGGHPRGTLAQALAGRAGGGDPLRAGIVHRLDKDTSGLLVVREADAVYRALQELIRSAELRREYLALVEGRPPARSGTIDAPIGRDRRVRARMSTDTDVPRPALTHFEIAEALPASTLLRVRLETGRTHQIRVHLLAIGHPVAGDPEYGRAGLLGLHVSSCTRPGWRSRIRSPARGSSDVAAARGPGGRAGARAGVAARVPSRVVVSWRTGAAPCSCSIVPNLGLYYGLWSHREGDAHARRHARARRRGCRRLRRRLGRDRGGQRLRRLGWSGPEISLVAYSTPQVVYDEIISDFQKTPEGKGVDVKASYGPRATRAARCRRARRPTS